MLCFKLGALHPWATYLIPYFEKKKKNLNYVCGWMLNALKSHSSKSYMLALERTLMHITALQET